MRRELVFIRIVVPVVALQVLALVALTSAAFAQEKAQGLSGIRESSVSSLTGAGDGDRGIAAAKPGRADGSGNQALGGERRPLYRLRPSDVIDLSFTVAPEFNQTLTVQPDGYVTLKDAGMVDALGLTLAEFGDAVRKAYHGILHDPQAAVALKDFDHPYFIVGGQVGKPGKYELRADTTVAEAVEIAGGMTSLAKHSQVVLFRHVNEELIETRVLNLKKMLRAGGLNEDAHLLSGDMVFVPQNAISKIAQFMTKPTASMYVNSTQF